MTSEVLLHGVCFAHEQAPQALFTNLTLHLATGWTGVVGANGAGKTTLLHLAVGLLAPTQGAVQRPGAAEYCAQRTDAPPPGLGSLLQAQDGEAQALRGRLGVASDWLARWETLSHGERKRAQIGVALWLRPALLAVDEPTNHIDGPARALLAAALAAYGGVGLLVSHDRELLDSLCHQCLFVDPPGAVLRPGGYSAGAAQAQVDQRSAMRCREEARRDLLGLEQEAVRRQQQAARSDRRRSKRGLGKDNDARFRRNLARMSGKDGVDGRLLRQLDGRLEQARTRLAQARVGKQYELGIWLPGACSPRDVLLREPCGYLHLGDRRRLRLPALTVRPQDRVAIVGPNGSGKTTLVAHLVGRADLPAERVVYLPQEVDAELSRQVMVQVRQLGRGVLGRTMTAVSRLGSRPERLLASAQPSPGEVRKVLLAMGIARQPHLVVMDEPTNHLDLPSIECLEDALSECPCCLLLVSHDQRFLQRLTRTTWTMVPDADSRAGDVELVVGERRPPP